MVLPNAAMARRAEMHRHKVRHRREIRHPGMHATPMASTAFVSFAVHAYAVYRL